MDNNIDKRVWLGMVFIVLGILFLLNSLEIISFNISNIIFSWQFFFIVIGLIITINTNKKLLGGILSGIGVVFIIPKIFPTIEYDFAVVLAIIFIALGLYIILNKVEKERSSILVESQDTINDLSIFGGSEKSLKSDNFKGGSITAIFGGSEINLKECKLSEGNNIIDILCVFGGTTIKVPSDWNVIINITPIFGGFSNKIIKDPLVQVDTNKKIIVKGLVIFGGGEIKS